MGALLILVIVVGVLLSPLAMFDKDSEASSKVFGAIVFIGLGLWFLSQFDMFQPMDKTKKVQISQVNQSTTINEEKASPKLEPTIKENKKSEEEIATEQLKKKMDFLIPMALEYKWKETDVRNAV